MDYGFHLLVEFDHRVKEVTILIDLGQRWGRVVQPGPAIHCGAHEGQEAPLYKSLLLSPVIWIEANPKLVAGLRTRILSHERVIEGAVWNESGLAVELNVMSNSESSSLLELGTHATHYPDITNMEKISCTTVTIDEVCSEIQGEISLINLDIQGAELNALQGSVKTLQRTEVVYCEVNFEELYKGCPKIEEIDSFLRLHGFVRVLTRRTMAGWGDALYMKNSRLNLYLRTLFFLQSIRYGISSFVEGLAQLKLRAEKQTKIAA